MPLWGLAAMLLLLACLYFYLLKPDLAGFLYDDGMYLMSAKALASGQGYRLIDIAGSPWFYKYPPLYPLCLAGMWLIHSDFPANIPWLKSLNIVLVILSLGLLFYYFRRHLSLSSWISLGLIAMLGTNWHLIEVTIEMMSEPLFLLLSIFILIVMHPVSHSVSQRRLWLLILLSIAAFYTRTMGLTLILAVGGWLALNTNRKQAFTYWGSCLLAIIPWFAWSTSKPDTTQAVGDFLVRSFQETYFQSLRMDLKYEYTLPELIWGGIRELLGNASIQFFPLLERLQSGKATLQAEMIILTISFVIALCLGRAAYQAWRQRQITFNAVYVSIYLATLPVWSFYKCYPRFLIVILPLLLVFFLRYLQKIQCKKMRHTAIGMFFLTGLVGNAIHLQAYIAKPYANTLAINSKADVWSNYSGVLKFIREYTPPDAVIHTDNVDETYLYALNTGRKALDRFVFLPKNKMNRACPTDNKQCLLHLYENNAEATLQVLLQNKVSYLVVNRMQITKMPASSWRLTPKTSPASVIMLAQNPDALIPVAQTPDGWITVYQLKPNILPASETGPFNQETYAP
jgi:hypothetical protein